MRDGEWTLSYPGESVTFGPTDLPIFAAEMPVFGSPELRLDDSDVPRGDGVSFGMDYRGGTTITFELGVTGASEAEARQLAADLSRIWRADAIRSTAGAVAELRFRYAGRERLVYGRPRRFAIVDQHAADGLVFVVADFATVDDLMYDTSENVVNMGIVAPAGGGLTGTLSAPLTTTATSDRSTVFTVGGELGAWPVVEITGPVTNPAVEVVGLFTIELATSLAFDQSVTVDPRPWKRTVTRANGGSLAGTLTRSSTRLAKTAMPPGTYELVLRGIDGTGTANMRFSWRDTYAAP